MTGKIGTCLRGVAIGGYIAFVVIPRGQRRSANCHMAELKIALTIFAAVEVLLLVCGWIDYLADKKEREHGD